MDSKIKGVLLGVAGIILWFMPLMAWQTEFMGETTSYHQAGHHIGGIAYLLLVSSIAYAALSWFEQHQLRIIAASVATGIGGLFLIQGGSRIAWGLLVLTVVSVASILLAISDNQKVKKVKES